MPISEEMKAMLGRALGKIPSGLFVVCAAHEGVEAAQLASWLQQAAFDPPAITVALARQRKIADIIRASGHFAVSILGESDHALMKKYARGVEPGPEAFSAINVLRTPQGLPILADALGWLECGLIKACEFGADHELLIGEVAAGQVLRDGKPFVHVRGNGFHY